ncbi:NACHT domain-containing protein [Nocardia tengchongensis]|uniref:NACHT domain-containing protein n=1 Tax=Nocardia tengchongensis TaxID=2055889 RepID=UPI0036CB5E57
MDYDLSRLGDKQFEHLAQALVMKYFGPEVKIFGAGPDGGREASWEGDRNRLPFPIELRSPKWDDYSIAQAKYRDSPMTPSDNLKWLLRQIRIEFDDWADSKKNRGRRPESYLVITNVKLSSVPGSGVDKAELEILNYARRVGVNLNAVEVWHYDRIRVMLDDSIDIRSAYAAWITPGDVLSQLGYFPSALSGEFKSGLYGHAAKLLREDVRLNLTQAGSVGDGSIYLSDIYIDLPASGIDHETPTTLFESFELGYRQEIVPGITEEIIAVADQNLGSNALRADEKLGRACRIVIVGGPGQGKSTVTQYLTQYYRSLFIHESGVEQVPEVRNARNAILDHAQSIDLSRPKARRWPVRIVISELADALAKGLAESVLQYISLDLAKRSRIHDPLEGLYAWLKCYPWIVIFDGLDEVPESSNRQQVVSAITDFYIEARGLEADILIVTTTRPQGYSDEFSRAECRHYELTPLPLRVALSYANDLISLRLGDDSRADRVRSTLKRASVDPSTRKLMSSPLQTTILTILIERLGHAPKDRWKLFSNYYRVIYQREQEKGGPLAELLQDYESDINSIHHEIGFLLQRRGEESGDSTSSLTKDEFTQIIGDRMLKNGNSAEASASLAEEIVRLATDRLVFLAVLRSDAIGFEIRSLQEYMASEKIVAGPESDIGPNLQAISHSSYWENVFLFAVGCIFATKEHLSAEVITVCRELNIATEAHRATLVGSQLAYKVLTERVAITRPRFSRLLATSVTELLRIAPTEYTCGILANLSDSEHSDELVRSIREGMSGSWKEKASAVLTLGFLADNHERPEDVYGRILDEILESFNDESLKNLLALSFRFEQTAIGRRLGTILDSFDITELSTLLMDEIDLEEPLVEPISLAVPKRMITLRSLLKESYSRNVSCTLSDSNGLALTGSPIEINRANLLDLIISLDGVDSWATVREILLCAERYNISSLVEAMKIAATLAPDHVRSISALLPWPFNICLEEVAAPRGPRQVRYMGDTTQYKNDRLLELVEAAQDGRLGDDDQWTASIDSLPEIIDLDNLRKWIPSPGRLTGEPLPVGPSCSVEVNALLILRGVSQNVTILDRSRWVTEAFETAGSMAIGPARDTLYRILRFTASEVDGYQPAINPWNTRKPINVSLHAANSALDEVRLGHSLYETTEWLRLWNAGMPTLFEDMLNAISNSPHISIDVAVDVDWMVDQWPDGIPWKIARMVVLSMRNTIPLDFTSKIAFGDGIDGSDRLKSILRALDISRGAVDSDSEAWMHHYMPLLGNSRRKLRVSPKARYIDPLAVLRILKHTPEGMTFVSEICNRLPERLIFPAIQYEKELLRHIVSQRAHKLSFEEAEPKGLYVVEEPPF